VWLVATLALYPYKEKEEMLRERKKESKKESNCADAPQLLLQK
jgi:hypothetical protein